MPKNKLALEFVEKFKEKYPEVSEEELYKTCLYPYEYFKKRLRDKDLPDFRLKYFGSFQIFAKPILSEIKTIEEKIKFKEKNELPVFENTINDLKKLEDYVKKHKELFERYTNRKKTSG